MTELTAENVTRIISDSLFRSEEVPGDPGEKTPPADAVIVEGIMNRWAFHPGRLEGHRQEIADMLSQLPEEFQIHKGGGWTFLNACMTRDGRQWGEHRSMDELFSLGQGLKLVKCQMPRDMWRMLPGGMPYYSVNLGGFK